MVTSNVYSMFIAWLCCMYIAWLCKSSDADTDRQAVLYCTVYLYVYMMYTPGETRSRIVSVCENIEFYVKLHMK